MTYLSTTDLRTKASLLVKMLASGKSVGLLHRSKVVGQIEPVVVENEDSKDVNVVDLKIFLQKAAPKVILKSKDKEKIYREHMMKKYGK